VEYKTGGIYYLLHKTGFSEEARGRHPKSASESEKKRFKKKARACARYYSQKGYTVMAADEASHMISWNIRNGRYPEGGPATAPVSLSRKRSCSYGALKSGVFHCRFDRNSTDSFIDFLAGLRSRFGRVLLFVDNASYHKSARLKERLAEWDGDVLIRYLPPYTPELNPVKVQWDIIKKAAANVLYGNTDTMRRSVRRLLRIREARVAEMSHYLM